MLTHLINILAVERSMQHVAARRRQARGHMRRATGEECRGANCTEVC